MVEEDTSDTQRLVQEFRTESGAYYRQVVVWLGVGSAGAGITIVSLVARLPNSDHAFRIFLPSMVEFIIGILTASFSILFLSYSKSLAAKHFAASHNRDQFSQAARKLPQLFSSPRRIADEANQERNQLIERANKSHESAEAAWLRHRFWKVMNNLAVIVSAAAFVCGLSWPIVFVELGGSLVK